MIVKLPLIFRGFLCIRPYMFNPRRKNDGVLKEMAEKNIDQLINELSLLNLSNDSRYCAKPTFISNPHDFYIIPMPLLYYLPLLSKPGEHLKFEDLKVGKVVIFTSHRPDVNKYIKTNVDNNIRGVIQNIKNGKKCDLHALDRGFLEKDVSIDRIFYTASDDASKIPSLVQHCELDYCNPKGSNFSAEDIDTFVCYIGNEKLRVVIRGKSSDKLIIAIYNSNCDDIATLMAYAKCTLLTKGANDLVAAKNLKPKLAYKHMVLGVDEQLTVRVQSGSTLDSFYVTHMSAYNSYLKKRPDFTDYCRRLPEISSDNFIEDAVVGVRYDNYYERAIILETLDDKAKVKLVDWGTDLLVPRNVIKPLKSDFFLMEPICAIYCSAVEGFVPWKNGLPVFLYKGYTFEVKVREIGKGFDIPHVVEISKEGSRKK